MQLPSNFNPQDFDPAQGGGDQLPVSDEKGHKVVIIASEQRQTNNKDGWYLQFTLKIVEGPYAGRVGAYRLNIGNANQQTVDIAYRQMSTVCYAIGQLAPIQNTMQLHNRPFRVVVGLQAGEEAKSKGWSEVKTVLDNNGLMPSKTGPQQQNPNLPPATQFPQNGNIGTAQPGMTQPTVGQLPAQQYPAQQPMQQPAPQPQQWQQPPQQTTQFAPQQQNPQAAPWNQPPQQGGQMPQQGYGPGQQNPF